MMLQYPIEKILEWAKKGEAMSPNLALEIIEENVSFKRLIIEVCDLLAEEDPILLRKIDLQSLQEWREKAEQILGY